MKNKFKQTLIALKEALNLKESTKVSFKNYKNEKTKETLTGDIEKVHDFLLANDFNLNEIITHYINDDGKTIKLAQYERAYEVNGHDYYIEIKYILESGKLQSADFIEDYNEHRRGSIIKSVDEFKEEFVEWAIDFKITDLFKY